MFNAILVPSRELRTKIRRSFALFNRAFNEREGNTFGPQKRFVRMVSLT